MQSTQTVYASAERTATPTAVSLGCGYARGLHLVIDVTEIGEGSPSVTPKIDAHDSLSGKYYPLLTGAAIVAEGTVVLKVYPGITAATNVAVSDVVTETVRVTMTHADTDPVTYTVAVHLVD